MAEKIGSKVGYFLVGLGIGSLIGILLAPKSGEDTREYLSQKVRERSEYAQMKARELKERAEELVERGKELVAEKKENSGQPNLASDDTLSLRCYICQRHPRAPRSAQHDADLMRNAVVGEWNIGGTSQQLAVQFS